jgi:hypothetical protein
MKEIIVYTNTDLLWGNAWLKEETDTHFIVVSEAHHTTTIQFPKRMFYFQHLTNSVDVL